MFDQPNQNLPEPEDILTPAEGPAPAKTALEAGRLRPVGEPPAEEPAGEEIEIRQPLLTKRKAIVLGVIIILVVAGVAAFLIFRRGAPPSPPPSPAVREGEEVAPAPAAQLEIPPLAPPTPAPAPVTQPVTIPPPAAELPSPVDSDGDGLSDPEEVTAGTNPLAADTDGDGLNDREELKVWKTNPLAADTDGDGFLDGAEVQNGYNPNGPGKLLPPTP